MTRLEYLLDLQARMLIQPSEREELMALIQDPANDAGLQDLLRQYVEEIGPDLQIPVESSRMILQTIFQAESPAAAPVIRIHRRRTWKYAAAILVFLVAGFLFWNNHKRSVPLAGRSIQKALLPGQQGAILILGDGEAVALDSASNGWQRQQGGSRISKQGGQLSYAQNPESKTAELVYNSVRTPKGRVWQLTLADGTRVWLNAESSIRYPARFSGKERSVEITGEAYFEIAKDKNKPFLVNVPGQGKIQVLGTRFNCNAYTDEPAMNTTLLDGAVRVTSMVPNTPASVLLEPGEQARIEKGGKLSVEPHPELEEVMAWKNGYFTFSGATLETILRQVSRWYDAEIVYAGDVRSERFAGSVPRSSNASKLLEVLALTKTVQFTIRDGKIIVEPYHQP